MAHAAAPRAALADRGRHLAVDAVHHADRARGAHGGAELPLRGGRDRPRLRVVQVPPDHAAAGLAAAADRGHVPRDRGVPALRPGLHPHRRRPGRHDRDALLQRLQGRLLRLRHRPCVRVRHLDGDRRHDRRAVLSALPQQASGALEMAAHIQPAGVADAGIAGETAAPPPIRRKRKLGNGFEIVLLAIFAIVMLFPVLWMLETALKDTKDIYAVPAKLITGWTPTFDHVMDVFSSDSPVFKGFKNSVIVASLSTIVATVLGVPSAWAYSRFAIKGKKDQLFFILSTRFMPPVVVVIPIFLMFRDLNLLDTLQGLILVYAAFNLPF